MYKVFYYSSRRYNIRIGCRKFLRIFKNLPVNLSTFSNSPCEILCSFLKIRLVYKDDRRKQRRKLSCTEEPDVSGASDAVCWLVTWNQEQRILWVCDEYDRPRVERYVHKWHQTVVECQQPITIINTFQHEIQWIFVHMMRMFCHLPSAAHYDPTVPRTRLTRYEQKSFEWNVELI